MTPSQRLRRATLTSIPLLSLAAPALAEDTLNKADTAWMLTASLLVYTVLAVALALRLMSRDEVQTGSVSNAPWRALLRLIGTRS